MDALAIYAIIAGVIFAGLFLAWTLSTLAKWLTFFSILLARHLTLPFIVYRHRLLGPWTCASVLLYLSYAAINAFLVVFRVDSLTGAGCCVGELALVNLIYPLSAIYLSNVADLLGISWSTCRKIHCATGWMATALLAVDVFVVV